MRLGFSRPRLPRCAATAWRLPWTSIHRGSRSSLSGDCVDRPGTRHAFQLALAAGLEDEARARDQILDRAGDENLARLRSGRYAGPDRDRDARDFAVVEL